MPTLPKRCLLTSSLEYVASMIGTSYSTRNFTRSNRGPITSLQSPRHGQRAYQLGQFRLILPRAGAPVLLNVQLG